MIGFLSAMAMAALLATGFYKPLPEWVWNILLFALWFHAVSFNLCWLFFDKFNRGSRSGSRPLWRIRVAQIVWAVIVLLLAGHGMFWLAGFLLVGSTAVLVQLEDERGSKKV